MTDLPLLNIPRLLRDHSLHPSKGMGQNYLVDEQALQDIIKTAEIKPDEAILEIGPGLGSLTRHLAKAAHTVTAVEMDANLIPVLTSLLKPFSNICLIQGDILQLDPGDLMQSKDYLVVANIPYNITSALVRHLLECTHRPRRIVLTIQKEVAERICALPGKLSILALSVQIYGKPRLHAIIPAQSFYPAPKVDSAILSVEIYPEPIIPASLQGTFFKLVKAGFSQKRKTLRNSLSSGLKLPTTAVEERLLNVEIDPKRRAETLNLTEWENLSREYLQGGKTVRV
jgi:16S rRNA (adenine1518-N6/adenine1519-N6)-dimethyltransferase